MKIHSRENNKESQFHLDKNKAKFTAGCLKVLELLRQGKRLTTINSPGYGILSLPRRIKDLRDHNGIKNIVDEWDEKTGCKVWYINFKTETENLYLTGKPTAADHAGKILSMQKEIFAQE